MPESATAQEKREYYRLRFPHVERPHLVIGQDDCQVVDCSARGLRYILPRLPAPAPAPGDWIEGLLQFRRHPHALIRGLVVRIQDGEIALHLPDEEIPFTVLRGEERYLLAHYRRWPE